MSIAKEFRRVFGVKGKTVYLGRGLYNMTFDIDPIKAEEKVRELARNGVLDIKDVRDYGNGSKHIFIMFQNQEFSFGISNENVQMMV